LQRNLKRFEIKMRHDLHEAVYNRAMREARREAGQQYASRIRFLEKTREQLTAQNERERRERQRLERRLERVPSADRGDFNEEKLLELLSEAFRGDTITKQKRGRVGTDIVHEVNHRVGRDSVAAGRIVYECKDVQGWSDRYVTQALEAGRIHSTSYIVLVTEPFPRKHKEFAVVQGVIVVHPAHLVDVAHVLRRWIVDVYRAGLTAEGQRAKTNELYKYLGGPDFRRSFESITRATVGLSKMLDAERRQHAKTWKVRERWYKGINDSVGEMDANISSIIERPERGRVVRLAARRASKAIGRTR
jgi:hypothetical protein